MGVILYSGWLSTELCQRFPDMTFVFGDNLRRFGKGGQAIIRDEPNAFGVPTKRKPSMNPGSFFDDNYPADLDAVLDALGGLWEKLRAGETIVIPVTAEGKVSLGLERAELPQRAPLIHQAICTHVDEMLAGHGGQIVSGL